MIKLNEKGKLQRAINELKTKRKKYYDIIKEHDAKIQELDDIIDMLQELINENSNKSVRIEEEAGK